MQKKNINSPAEEAEYYFCKNARCNDYGRLDSAIVYGQIAAEKFKVLNNFNSLCYVYHNLSKSYNKQGAYDKAIKVLILGLKVAEKSNNEYWISHFTTSISLNYHDFESYKKGVYDGLKDLKSDKNDNIICIKFSV